MVQTLFMDLAGSIDIAHLVDTVQILSSAPITFNFNAFWVSLTVLPADIDGWGEGIFCGNLTARVNVTNNCNPVPEPAALTLMGIGLVGAAAKLRQRRRAKSA